MGVCVNAVDFLFIKPTNGWSNNRLMCSAEIRIAVQSHFGECYKREAGGG